MANILVDNWTLQKAAVGIKAMYENKSKPTIECIRLVEAILLWDKVYYVENEFSFFWQEILNQFSDIQFIHKANELCENQEEYDLCKQNSKFISLHLGNDIVGQGAIEYQAITDKLGVNYLPCEERARFLSSYNRLDKINRTDIMKYFEKSVLQYYNDINNKLGTTKIKFENPAFFDYIYSNAGSEFIVDTAINMKDRKELMRFRKSMDNFERVVENGDLLFLDSALNDVRQTFSTVGNKFGVQAKGELVLSLSPGFIPSLVPRVTLGVKALFGRSINISFLRMLSDYALRERVVDRIS